jgi:hypothetical protein
MKEPLRGIRYNNTREAIIRAVGRSLLDINRSGRANGVRRLPQIWQKVVHMGEIILKECKCGIRQMCLPQIIKSFQNYRGVATTFYPTLVYIFTFHIFTIITGLIMTILITLFIKL